ncbi:MAG: hypothetical protein FWE66_00005, partial [Oscillospiraceae bacterium]|nr:hypothetical protein [Oscillospiraceae bacterium]
VYYVTIPVDIQLRPGELDFEIYVNDSFLGKMNPLFAKAVFGYGGEVPSADGFAIRTEEQIKNISMVNTKDLLFVQERHLDFTGYTFEQSVVQDVFEGRYNGNGKNIIGVVIDGSNSNAAGLFGHNKGSVEGVTLAGPTEITGGAIVGGIAGVNDALGTISNCIVTGGGKDLDVVITGTGSVGGIAGLNLGAIENCIVIEEEDMGLVALDGESGKVGGIAGTNGAGGKIEGCSIDGLDTGLGIAGVNDGSIINCVIDGDPIDDEINDKQTEDTGLAAMTDGDKTDGAEQTDDSDDEWNAEEGPDEEIIDAGKDPDEEPDDPGDTEEGGDAAPEKETEGSSQSGLSAGDTE